ncbi:hypothetical protein JG688_00004908 [Phytophthora aleatoria]|uniref:Uncharacterized protein n=1 Tax=Phytophthora aleatoria TaxID=2496075 RepID=A0A8J5INM0_9STRA|nr:hypothetical protein JG688_00004908 [Phytophthora aleatoria]
MQLIPHQRPKISLRKRLSFKERLKWMVELFVSVDAMGISSREVIELQLMQ